MSTPTIAIPVWRSLALMPLGVAIVALMVTQPLQAQSTPQPCTTRANYDQAKAAADAADAAFRKLKEPDWSKLPEAYQTLFDPADKNPLVAVDRDKRVEALLKKLKDDLQKNKKAQQVK